MTMKKKEVWVLGEGLPLVEISSVCMGNTVIANLPFNKMPKGFFKNTTRKSRFRLTLERIK